MITIKDKRIKNLFVLINNDQYQNFAYLKATKEYLHQHMPNLPMLMPHPSHHQDALFSITDHQSNYCYRPLDLCNNALIIADWSNANVLSNLLESHYQIISYYITQAKEPMPLPKLALSKNAPLPVKSLRELMIDLSQLINRQSSYIKN